MDEMVFYATVGLVDAFMDQSPITDFMDQWTWSIAHEMLVRYIYPLFQRLMCGLILDNFIRKENA